MRACVPWPRTEIPDRKLILIVIDGLTPSVFEAAVGDGRRADEFEALRHAYTALDGAYQMLGQPERAVHERMSLDL